MKHQLRLWIGRAAPLLPVLLAVLLTACYHGGGGGGRGY